MQKLHDEKSHQHAINEFYKYTNTDYLAIGKHTASRVQINTHTFEGKSPYYLHVHFNSNWEGTQTNDQCHPNFSASLAVSNVIARFLDVEHQLLKYCNVIRGA
jgi:hypothetical protein